MALLGLIITTAIVTILGGGLGYFVWLKTRPKKETWKANVYMLGDGVRPPILDKRGKVISDLRLQDLRTYGQDILVKEEQDTGITIFKLIKLGKATPAVESDVVEYWGPGNRTVDVLYYNDQCTLLKKGYDSVVGQKIYTPLAHSRISTIKQELTLRKNRQSKEKDILQAITPFIVVGISMMALIGIAYLMIQGLVHISDQQTQVGNALDEKFERLVRVEEARAGIINLNTNPLGAQTNNGNGIIVITDG